LKVLLKEEIVSIELNVPTAGDLNWDVSVNANWQTIENALNLTGRNRIINGSMRINQRNPGAMNASTSNGGFLTDRFFTAYSYNGTLTWTHDSDSPSNAQAGRKFNNSIKLTSTQDSDMGTNQLIYLGYKIEGYDITDLIGDGYNNGFTLSFWVKSSTTGTYCVALRNSGADRTYVAEYTVNSANSWEQKVISVSAVPSGGTWDITNGLGLFISWALAVGTDYDDGTNGAWASSNELCTSNQVNWCSTSGSHDFWITGVQFEAGTQSTDFDFRYYGVEIALCQRYCYVMPAGYMPFLMSRLLSNYIEGWVKFPTTMRSTPTLTTTITTWDADGSPAAGYISSYNYAATAWIASSTSNAATFYSSGHHGEGVYFDVTVPYSFSGYSGDVCYIWLGSPLIWSCEL
jgi:hypothetical protein